MKIDSVAEMAYPQKVARDVIIGMSRPINRHLTKLVAFEFPEEMRSHFKRELRSWLDEIQTIRLKPTSRTGSFKFYFDPLFEYPFGGVEIKNARALLEFISREYDGRRPSMKPDELIDFLRRFHIEIAERLHEGEDVLDMIPS
jgi:hypothetical protein